MPITAGHGNPSWTIDETLLALELYNLTKPKIPGSKDPRIVDLSALLNRLPIHPIEIRKNAFRNPASVEFKLQNLRAVATGKGLSNIAKNDRVVWERYGSNPDLVRGLSLMIRQAAGFFWTVPTRIWMMTLNIRKEGCCIDCTRSENEA